MRIDNETIVTSSGIIKNRSIPRSGIVNASSLYDELFQDCLNDGIDLTYESWRIETMERLKNDNPEMDDIELDDLLQRENDFIDCDSHVFLLGAWVKDSNGQYIIDKSGKSGNYAIEYNTENGIVCVEWSTLTKECNNTSPCYVMADGSGPCGDLDTQGNNVIAYTLPIEMFRTNDK